MPGKKNKKKARPRPTKGEGLRGKINVAALIEALEQHVLGKKEMTATQVSAALALLKKTLPDLSEPARKLNAGAPPPRAHEDALEELE